MSGGKEKGRFLEGSGPVLGHKVGVQISSPIAPFTEPLTS